jgi:transcriptional regulator with XRE-family HTH domain
LRELREIRLRRGLSQADLSAMTGVAEFTISEIEAGKRANPRPSTLRKLAQALEVEVADLYGDPTYPNDRAPSPEPPLFNGLEEERRPYPYPWLAGTLALALGEWARIVDARENAFYSRTIAVICFDLIDAVTLGYREEWDSLPAEEKPERRLLAETLDALAMRGFEHYKASKAAQKADVREIEQRRREIKRRTQELSA